METAELSVVRQEKDFTDAEKVELARANHIWLNAFSCVRPTPGFLQGIGAHVVACLLSSPMADDWTAAPKSVTYIRVNRS